MRRAGNYVLRQGLGQGAPVRGMATEKEIALRINSTKNIMKITSSMKMVSAAKLNADKRRLASGKPFAAWLNNVSDEPIAMEDFDWESDIVGKKNLWVAVTSDKGLCGGVNSAITRQLKKGLPQMVDAGKDVELFIIGEKGRSQLRRQFGDLMKVSCSEVFNPLSFSLSSAIATEIENPTQFDSIHICYNIFVSAIAYTPSIKTLVPFKADGDAESLVSYEFEPDTKGEVLDNLFEMVLATQIYYSQLEAATSEQSSRMQAMENATKNAGELVDKLTLIYNRARQARITTELVEIISGASALED